MWIPLDQSGEQLPLRTNTYDCHKAEFGHVTQALVSAAISSKTHSSASQRLFFHHTYTHFSEMKRLITKFKRLSSKSPVAIDVSGPSSPDIEAMDDPTHDIIEHSSPTWLHDVPPEIRRYLLSLLNLSQLKQLVRASSVFHQQYLFDRKCLLQQSIKETIGSAVIDAHAVLLFTSYYEDHEHEILALFASDPDGQIYHTLVSLLNGYSENSVKRCCSSFEELDQDSLSAISAFYFKAVRPFAEYCTRQAWDQLAEQSQNKESCRNLEWNPSRTELLRFTRAVYRFQLLCLIVKIARPVSHGSIETLILKFLSAFEAWEIEELYCVFLFATDVYDKVFNRIWEDLHPRNPRFDDQGRPPTPHGAFDLEPREWNCK